MSFHEDDLPLPESVGAPVGRFHQQRLIASALRGGGSDSVGGGGVGGALTGLGSDRLDRSLLDEEGLRAPRPSLSQRFFNPKVSS